MFIGEIHKLNNYRKDFVSKYRTIDMNQLVSDVTKFYFESYFISLRTPYCTLLKRNHFEFAIEIKFITTKGIKVVN